MCEYLVICRVKQNLALSLQRKNHWYVSEISFPDSYKQSLSHKIRFKDLEDQLKLREVLLSLCTFETGLNIAVCRWSHNVHLA